MVSWEITMSEMFLLLSENGSALKVKILLFVG